MQKGARNLSTISYIFSVHYQLEETNCTFQLRALYVRATMVDKIPWDTCVISLIFGVFKTEFYKSSCAFQNALLSPPPPNAMLKLWRNSVYMCQTL